MTKKTIIIVVVIVTVLGIIGAMNPSKETPVEQKTVMVSRVAPTNSTVDTYAEKIGATNKTEVYYQVISAKDGAKYTLNDKVVEIYDFDIDKLADGLKQLYKDGLEIRRVDNTVFVFHDYPEDSAEVDAIMQKAK